MNRHIDKFLSIFDTIDFNKIKDHPNILIAAIFWEEERFHAAKLCYGLMRMIDDLIDNYKTENKLITTDKRKMLKANIDDWLKMIVVSKECSPPQQELQKTMDKFIIPLWPMEAFAKSMIYDITHNGFSTLESYQTLLHAGR
jgi:phytoene/squalene synthetase